MVESRRVQGLVVSHAVSGWDAESNTEDLLAMSVAYRQTREIDKVAY